MATGAAKSTHLILRRSPTSAGTQCTVLQARANNVRVLSKNASTSRLYVLARAVGASIDGQSSSPLVDDGQHQPPKLRAAFQQYLTRVLQICAYDHGHGVMYVNEHGQQSDI